MLFRLVFGHGSAWLPRWVALAGLGVLAVGCVAQEGRQSPGDGGAAGKSSTSGGELNLGGGGTGATSGSAGSGATTPVGPDCTSSAQCAVPHPYCVPALGTCVECLASKNCSGTGRPYCDTTRYTCLSCLSDRNCTSMLPYCAPDSGECVECLSSANCGGVDGVCDRYIHRCVPACETNADCAAAVDFPYCDPARNLCVECLADPECPAAKPHCETASKHCVPCVGNEDCAAPRPLCDPHEFTCVECLSSADCHGNAACDKGICVDPK